MMPSASFALIYWLALQCAWTVRCQEHEGERDDQPVEIPPTRAIEGETGPLTSPPISGSTDVFDNACVSDIEACGSVVELLRSCKGEENQLECRCQSEITSLEHSCHFIDAKQCQGSAFNPATIHTDVMFYGQCEGGPEAWAEAIGTVSFFFFFRVLLGEMVDTACRSTGRAMWIQTADDDTWDPNRALLSQKNRNMPKPWRLRRGPNLNQAPRAPGRTEGQGTRGAEKHLPRHT